MTLTCEQCNTPLARWVKNKQDIMYCPRCRHASKRPF